MAPNAVNDSRKTKAELLEEVAALRERVRELETAGQKPAPSEPRHDAALSNPLAIVLEHTTDAIWSIDRNYRILTFNAIFQRRFESLFGVTPKVGMGPADLVSPFLGRSWIATFNRAFAGERFTVQQRYPVEGKERVYDLAINPVVADGEVTGVAVVSRDVTEKVRAEEDLKRQTGMLQLMLDSISDGVIVVDEQGKFMVFNRAAERMMGRGPVDVLPEAWSETFGLFLPDGATLYPADRLPLARAMQGESIDDCPVLVRRDETAEPTWLSASTRPLTSPDGSLRGGAVATFRDITEQRKIEAAREADQAFKEGLLMAHDRDRKLLAYEIHDGLVQHVTAAVMHLDAMAHEQAAAGTSDDRVALVTRLLREALEEGRRLIGGLRPPGIDELGLVAAIDNLVREGHDGEGPQVAFHSDVTFHRLESLLEGTVFRIIQEALTNIRRHSQALTARIELRQQGDRLQISICDDGVGFDPAAVPRRRVGLQGIRERARLLGGVSEIRSKPGAGTRISVTLPLNQPA